MANVLITGASGYLGGSVLALLKDEQLPPHGSIYALVRNQKQAGEVTKYGVTPITFDAYDKKEVEDAVLGKQISVVFFLIDALHVKAQTLFIDALGKLKETGEKVYFLHTSGAKIFSSLAGAPTDNPLLDNDPDLYKIQKSQKANKAVLQPAVEANNTVIELAEAKGVNSFIFVPCIVYGKGLGFGNAISIQTVAIVKAALAAKKVYRVDDDKPVWPVGHIYDTATLYIALLRSTLAGEKLGHGKNGYYLASSGLVAWDGIYGRMAEALAKRGKIDDGTVGLADDAALDKMAQGLGCPKELVQVQLAGRSTFTARHGASIGWKAKYPAEHILETADEEVDLILENL